EIRAALLKKRALNLTISDRIEGEIAEIRAALSELRSGFQPHVQLSLAPTLTGLHSRLLSQGVTEKLAAETISAVAAELSTRALADEEAVHACAARHLRRQLPETTPLQLNPGHPTVLFIIGPTGVGKTTTLAKLAGRYALAQRRRVALINTDTDRVVSASQLRTYGDALGLSTAIASTPAELQAQVETFHDRDLILVDMPGCSQYDQVALERHRAFLTNVPHRKVFLAVSCNTRYEEMLQIANRFALVSLDGLLFTKADETRLFGAVYDLACDLQLSLTYLTNGQRVPEDIEVATATRITQLLLEGS
ncbi:MAG TPA: hypothetical protein EYH31_08835, partial [Anaerolineae bacterium]|nr:hypothetical protein [Anaerolineae bacterium]